MKKALFARPNFISCLKYIFQKPQNLLLKNSLKYFHFGTIEKAS